MSDAGEVTYPNSGRQFNFDFIKMLIIFGLVPVHLFERCMLLEDYSVNHVGFTSIDSILSTIVEFGDGTIGACMFMFCLGVGLVYSSRKSAKFLFKRAWIILVAAIGLNFLTDTLYLTIQGVTSQTPELLEEAVLWLFCGDILSFAFLTFLFFALVRKLKLPNLAVIAIPAVLLIISSFIPKLIFPENPFLTEMVGWFVFQDCEYSFFPFMQWLIFPAAGYVFAQYLQKTENRDKFYGIVMLTGAVSFAGITAVSVLCGVDIVTFFTSFNACIYNKTLLSAVWSLSFVLFWSAFIYFLTRKVSPASRLHRLAENTSRRITVFYILQWALIGFLGYVLFPALNMVPLDFVQLLITAVILIIICYIISGKILKQIQKKRLSA